MPAPTEAAIKAALRASFIAAGPDKFAKRDDDGNAVPGQLPDALEDMIAAQAQALSQVWSTWQLSQPVSGTAGPFPVVGFLP
jgi:hypothetical protein